MSRSFVALVVALTCAGAAARAVGQDPASPELPKTGRQKAKIEIELPAAPKKQEEPGPATPEQLVASLSGDLAAYPGGAGVRAMERLVEAGPAVAAPLRALLEGADMGPKLAAALVLAQLADREALDALERLFRDRRHAKRCGVILSAIARIDRERADAVAVMSAGGKDAKLRAAGLKYLRGQLRPELAPALRALLGHADGRVRQSAFDLLAHLPGADLQEDAFALLGDEHAGLATAATAYLVEHRAAEATPRLLSLAREDPPSRRSLWALLTLAELEEEYSEALLGDDLIALCQPRLRSLDPLVRCSAAIALAQIGLRREAEDAEVLLREHVLPAIMGTFLENQYFQDYLPLFSYCQTRVQRITGLDLGQDVTKWREAWSGGGSTPLIRRDLDPARLSEVAAGLVIQYERRGMLRAGPDLEIVLAPCAFLGVEVRGVDLARAFYLDEEALRGLAAGLLASGVFEQGRAATRGERTRACFRRIRVVWENRERAVVVGSEADAAFAAAEDAIRRACDDAFWQKLFPGDPAAFSEFLRAEGPHFAPPGGT
ncbi:MAG: HEAT repeat domain-containing protein [Planctomycetes bacterium]|nr:HEAT repeat domain-containing protein [Planctomycetota bacterium]